VATTLSEAQAAQSQALTQAFKLQQNREAAKVAALVALYYQKRVNVEDPRSVDLWLSRVIPALIRTSDTGARNAAEFFAMIRRLEVPGAEPFDPLAALGMIDDGVRKSLMAVGPTSYLNKARDIRRLDVSPQQQKALLIEAKQITTTKLASAAVRHAQAGSRQTIYDNSERDRVALGYVRVTKAKPCHFCAMLASRGLRYRAFKEDSFTESDSRFTGDGDAKVHDSCGCSLKQVYVESDPLVARTEQWADMWALWGAGGRGDTEAALRFRRGYNHWAATGEFLTWEQVDEGLR
jgi:hypothetical protein